MKSLTVRDPGKGVGGSGEKNAEQIRLGTGSARQEGRRGEADMSVQSSF